MILCVPRLIEVITVNFNIELDSKYRFKRSKEKEKIVVTLSYIDMPLPPSLPFFMVFLSGSPFLFEEKCRCFVVFKTLKKTTTSYKISERFVLEVI